MHTTLAELLDPPAACLALLIAPRPVLAKAVEDLAPRLALAGPVRILDGGNRYAAYAVARAVRRLSPHLPSLLDRITIARAFTCFQMGALLARQKTGPSPLLVIDPLAVFADENIPLPQRSYLLAQLIPHLQRLALQAPVLIAAAPAHQPPLSAFLDRLAASAHQTVRLTPPAPSAQPRLF